MAESMDNKKRVQKLMSEMSEGRSRLFFDAMSDDVVWRWMGVHQWSRTFEGKEAIVDTLFGGSSETLPESSRILVHGIHGDGDVVVVEHSGRNELPDGRRYDNNYCWVFRFEDDAIKEVREYMDTQLVTRRSAPTNTPRELTTGAVQAAEARDTAEASVTIQRMDHAGIVVHDVAWPLRA